MWTECNLPSVTHLKQNWRLTVFNDFRRGREKSNNTLTQFIEFGKDCGFKPHIIHWIHEHIAIVVIEWTKVSANRIVIVKPRIVNPTIVVLYFVGL